MLCLGFRRQGHPGVICRQVMEIGKSLLLFLSLARQRSPGRLSEEQIDNFEFKLLMINAGHIKDHLHGSGARGGKQDMAKTRGSSAPRYVWSWMRMVYLCLECIRNCPAHALSLNPPHVCRLGSRTCRYAECDPVKCTHMVRGLSTEVWPGAVFNPNVDVPVEEAQSRMGHYDDLWNRRDARIRISEHAEATYGATLCGRCMAFCTAGHDAMNRRMRPSQTVYQKRHGACRGENPENEKETGRSRLLTSPVFSASPSGQFFCLEGVFGSGNVFSFRTRL